MDRQQAKTGQAGNGTLDAVGVADGLSQHLIAATDSYNSLSVTMGSLDGLRTTIAAQFQQVIKCGLRAWQDDDVCPTDV